MKFRFLLSSLSPRLIHTERVMKRFLAKDRLKTGKDYEISEQIFSKSFKKQDFQTILERYYLRFIILPCLKPQLKPLVFHNLLCVNRPFTHALSRIREPSLCSVAACGKALTYRCRHGGDSAGAGRIQEAVVGVCTPKTYPTTQTVLALATNEFCSHSLVTQHTVEKL